MQLIFEAVSEARPGPKWQALFSRYWPAYRAWLTRRGGPDQPTPRQARTALQSHMPELLPTYDRLLELAGGAPLAARLLSCFRPPAYLISCSQAALSRPGSRVLTRNYDLDPNLNEGLILHSAWTGRPVLASSEFLWGVADGMNDAGLALSLAFGGRRIVGDGFGIPLILRYVLEVCDDLDDALQVLRRVPSHMAYNVTLLDRRGRSATVQVGPDRPVWVIEPAVATNHQGGVEWAEHGRFTATLEREAFLHGRLADPRTTEQDLIEAFLRPPLYNTDYQRGFGTLYTAVYRPAQGLAQWHWPGEVWSQSIDDFREGRRQVHYSRGGARVAGASSPSRTRAPVHAAPWSRGDRVWSGADDRSHSDPILAAVKAGLSAGGCRLSPALKAWFEEAERTGGRIPWETLGSACAQQVCAR